MRSGRIHVRPRGVMDVLRRGNLGALVLPLVLLAAGAVARTRLARKTVPFRWHGIQLAHPVGWTVSERGEDSGDGDSVELVDLLGPGRIKPRVTLRIAALPPPADSKDVDERDDGETATATGRGDKPTAEQAGALAAESARVAPPPAPTSGSPSPAAAALSNRLPLYYVMAEQPVRVGDLDATRIDSAFAFTPPTPPGRKLLPARKGDIPVVMRAIDLVLLRGTDALSVQVAAPIQDFETQRPILEGIIASLKVDTSAPPADAVAAAAAEPVAAVSAGSASDSGAPTGVTVAGQVVDAESGLPVPGAIVLFLVPGTSVGDVSDDNLSQVAYTTGLADSAGYFASTRGLSRPGHYGVMVVADGYSWLGNDDGVSVANDAPERLDVGPVHLRRR